MARNSFGNCIARCEVITATNLIFVKIPEAQVRARKRNEGTVKEMEMEKEKEMNEYAQKLESKTR